MRVRFTRILILTMALVLSAATAAAVASTDETGPANLQVGATVLADDAFGIWVDAGNGQQGLWFNAVVGGSSNQQDFQMNVLNTTADGWKIDASGTDLTAFDTEADNKCNDQGWDCTYVDHTDGVTIPVTAWHVWGGDDGSGAVTAFHGDLIDSDVFTINTGTSLATGNFGLWDPNPSMQLTVPATPDTAGYEFYGTVTFTMTLVP